MLQFLSYLIVIAAQFSGGLSAPLQCRLAKTSPTFALPAALDASVGRYEADGWHFYYRCQRGLISAVVLLNEARSKYLRPYDVPGPPNNAIVASRQRRGVEELTSELRFVASSGDVGVCMITNIWPSVVLYECLHGDGPSAWREFHALRW